VLVDRYKNGAGTNNATDDGTSVGQNEGQYERTDARNDGKNGSQDGLNQAEMKADRKAHQARMDARHKDMMAKIVVETEAIGAETKMMGDKRMEAKMDANQAKAPK
jgi:hypothetical protein